MAITVRNREDLQRLALAKGASVTYADGKKFNSSRIVAKPSPRVAPPIEVQHQAPVTIPKQDPLLDAVREQNAMIAAEQSRISAMVTQALVLATQSPEPTKPQEWVFTVERDKRDRLVKVIARPV